MNLLDWLFEDKTMASIWSERETINYWLLVEAELAGALGDANVITEPEAEAISKACVFESINVSELVVSGRNVGYPIVGLVKMICNQLPESYAAKVHWGATTQDIMDTALVLQCRESLLHVISLQSSLADAIGKLVDRHQDSVMPGRTHGQQATPTTFGAKMAVFLEQLSDDREQTFLALEHLSGISLFGAAGTSAALHPDGPAVRSALAKRLQLADRDIPWHVNRNAILKVGQALSLTLATLSRLAREIIDLARTEIAEVAEGQGMYKGASSTMPQKANPVECESILGFTLSASHHGFALQRAAEAAHERSAGEWQVEWKVLPDIFGSTAAALALGISMISGLQVFPETMKKNCSRDHGLLLAEAFMMFIAPKIGRDVAHEQLYEIAMYSRSAGVSFEVSLRAKLDPSYLELVADFSFDPHDHIGDATRISELALENWKLRKTLNAKR